MIKGQQREQKESKGKQLFTGFSVVRVAAINPTREELNKLVGREDSEEDKEIKYLSQDNEGNDVLKLVFWLKDDVKDKFFIHDIRLINKVRTSKDGNKVQLINSIGKSTWVLLKDKERETVDEILIPDSFIQFTNKEKEVVGEKKWRKALRGEEELGILLGAWLGKLSPYDPDTEIFVDTKKLFAENYKELRSMIESGYDTPFIALLGVETDSNDPSKKYQKVFSKKFLPSGYMKYIEKGNKFPSDYSKKEWERFDKEINGEYGFKAFFKLKPLSEYNPNEDVSGGPTKQAPAPTTSEY